ncbi:MAG: hypothetical protein QGI83_17830 [Candidatus Latescibacteria bacterium]|jgi:hypothetical protein|nr:hypothetical protein [Candidatus Latescibacterota bacterium]
MYLQPRLKHLVSSALVVTLFVLAACGGDDATGPSGDASVPDHPGANTTITSSNAPAVMTEVSSSLYGALGRVMAAAATKPALTKTVSNKVINGQNSGTVTIKSGSYEITGTSQKLDASLEFIDFSDDGQIFMGGTVDFDLTMSTPTTVDPTNPLAGLTFNFTQKGNLAFSGKYKGTLNLDVTVSLSGGVPQVSGTVTVGGTTVNL